MRDLDLQLPSDRSGRTSRAVASSPCGPRPLGSPQRRRSGKTLAMGAGLCSLSRGITPRDFGCNQWMIASHRFNLLDQARVSACRMLEVVINTDVAGQVTLGGINLSALQALERA